MRASGNFVPGVVCIDEASHVNSVAKRNRHVRWIFLNNVPVEILPITRDEYRFVQ
jgi:hypothetical protein